MGNEILIVSVLALILGFIIGYIVFVKFKINNKIQSAKISKIINNPQKLKEELEKNGELVDEGKKIIFKIDQDEKGKDILKQENISVEPPDIQKPEISKIPRSSIIRRKEVKKLKKPTKPKLTKKKKK